MYLFNLPCLLQDLQASKILSAKVHIYSHVFGVIITRDSKVSVKYSGIRIRRIFELVWCLRPDGTSYLWPLITKQFSIDQRRTDEAGEKPEPENMEM